MDGGTAQHGECSGEDMAILASCSVTSPPVNKQPWSLTAKRLQRLPDECANCSRLQGRVAGGRDCGGWAGSSTRAGSVHGMRVPAAAAPAHLARPGLGLWVVGAQLKAAVLVDDVRTHCLELRGKRRACGGRWEAGVVSRCQRWRSSGGLAAEAERKPAMRSRLLRHLTCSASKRLGRWGDRAM